MKFCTCQIRSQSVFDCEIHGAMLREKSERYKREQELREARRNDHASALRRAFG